MYAARIGVDMPSKSHSDFAIHEEPDDNSASGTSSGLKVNFESVLGTKKSTIIPLITSTKGNIQGPEAVSTSVPFPVVDNDKIKGNSSSSSVKGVSSTGAHHSDRGESITATQFIPDSSEKSDVHGVEPSLHFGVPAACQGTAGLLKDPHGQELARLRKELEVAQHKIAYMDVKLSQNTSAKSDLTHILEQLSVQEESYTTNDVAVSSSVCTRPVSPMPRASPNTFGLPITDQLCSATNPSDAWPRQYGNGFQRQFGPAVPQVCRGWEMDSQFAYAGNDFERRVSAFRPAAQGPMSFAPDGSWHARDPRLLSTQQEVNDFNTRHGQHYLARPGPGAQIGHNKWPSYTMTPSNTPRISPPSTPVMISTPNQAFSQPPYQPRPVGMSLSPTALEFSAAAMTAQNMAPPGMWNERFDRDGATALDTSLTHMEPMNYRRLLDKNMSCNWRYIVDKIVCNNDQQASIFLQQKLKVATPEQKFELIEAIISQAYPLMVNRFGNFLVQRCFEHGTPEQVIAIANAIRGNTLSLSMDAFGCHVVQKAFDAVPEEYKAIMVHELLRRIPETVIHRYACHVWQKLFELRWSNSPPQIMKYVNEALRGMWHEVALGETGSLVVQNIFENCLEEDKRPCVNEVLASIDIVSHGQFGNWCIQHICEHGSPNDKNHAIEHVLQYATEYSTDQFASKVVEKCLKVGGTDFTLQYLNRVCEGRPDRPRMPLIDIAGDQYGNYLVQYILMHADMQYRELVAQHVRKHMVSLRGSKFGSRVAMLCSNPAFCARPSGPNLATSNHRYVSTNAIANNANSGRSNNTAHYR